MSVIPGTPDPETIPGTPDDDLINGFGGGDTLFGQGGNDVLYGGDGSDSILGDAGNDLIYGEAGNDTLQSGGDTDQLFGGDGEDLILVNDANYDGESSGYGGADNDSLAIFGTSHGHAYGGDGIDTLLLGNSGTGGLFVDLIAQTIDGHGTFPGVTFAGFERLNLLSFAGDDTAYGGNDSDRIDVNAGRNLVDAKGGDDYVSYITRGASTLEGGAGNDVLAVSGGDSSLYFIFDTFDGSIDDGQGSEISGFERYEAYGGRFADFVVFNTGNDHFKGGGDSDTAYGNDGKDTLEGQGGGDLLEGGRGADVLSGGAGKDSIYGGGGKDFIGGGAGDDLMEGGDGDDRIRFWSGHDTATGGAGRDWFNFTQSHHGLATITDFTSGVDLLRFNSLYLAGGPGHGYLDPALLSFGAASGSAAQFVLTYDAGTGKSTLVWDANGNTPSGTVDAYAVFDGQISLAASDIFVL